MRFFTSDIIGYAVAEDAGGQLWIVPPVLGGWSKRTPYRGHRASLQPWGTNGTDPHFAALIGAE